MAVKKGENTAQEVMEQLMKLAQGLSLRKMPILVELGDPTRDDEEYQEWEYEPGDLLAIEGSISLNVQAGALVIHARPR